MRIVQLHQRVRTRQVALRDALSARDTAVNTNQTFLDNVPSVVQSRVGLDVGRLLKYGIKPEKRRGRLPVDAGVIAAAREKATRAVHGTMGKRQREAITAEPKPTLVVTLPGDEPKDK